MLRFMIIWEKFLEFIFHIPEKLKTCWSTKIVICSRLCVCLHPVCKMLLLRFISCICFCRPAMNFTRNLQVITPVPKMGPNCIYFIYDKCLLFLQVSMDGSITVFTCSLFQCLTILAIRKLVLISNQNYPCCILSPCPVHCSHGEQTVPCVSYWLYAYMKVVVVFSLG